MNSASYESTSGPLLLPVIGAIVVHAIVVAVLIGGWVTTDHTPKEFEVPPNIKAEIVTLKKPEPKVAPKPVIKKPAPKPKPKPTQPKQVEKPVKAQPKPEAIKKVENAVPKTLEKPKEVPKEVPVVEPVVEEAPKAEPEVEFEEYSFEDMLAGLEAEEAVINQQIESIEKQRELAQEVSEQVSDYSNLIRRQIEQKWSRPVELRMMDVASLEAKVLIELLPTGELLNVTLIKSSGHTPTDDSVIRAIEKVARFEVPEDAEVFEAGGFRRLNIIFRPEDLLK